MGKRDIVKREAKKPKKDAKKPIIATVAPLPIAPPVEVVRKRRKHEDEESEEE